MKSYGVVLFHSTREAMRAELMCQSAKLSVRIIPTPEKIYLSCGFSLKFPLEAKNQIRHILAKNNVSSEGFYKALQVGLDVTYYLL
ncbi:DUF3343 domain-containing protein [Enterococcus hirae]|uniref:DUF3343 domain-containing protein n=1 Tax=Enterococcus hirae TaxID=1354 RepID=UPI0015F2494E|nr:DUF3343 domain-containing protein [Enterococcus hirae]EMF0268709.1 DUF3343 domain-containing protein [Enterococcus hirae]EMF0300450.1 DUF3343 domain-containing protein [Enterococcus hirae]MBA5275627.1 DUF3343 domain-containing protein [Enterococcus hirae]